MQMAGHIINRNAADVTNARPATTDPAQSTQQPNTTQPAPTAAGQNSQARGNTQTNPTTATHTRSTPRPHVHLAQQAMQGGFDPFLPCNSHHISRRRLYQANVAPASNTTANQQNSTQNNATRQETPPSGRTATGQNQNILNFINGIFDSIRSEYRRANETSAQNTTNSSTAQPNVGGGSANSSSNSAPNLPPFASLFSNLQGMVSNNFPVLIY